MCIRDRVNVERSMMMNGRLDGHSVQGHVDQTATCIDVKDAEGTKVTEIYCMADDFCKEFTLQQEKYMIKDMKTMHRNLSLIHI